jgi:small-conductance mechanosensitive channel
MESLAQAFSPGKLLLALIVLSLGVLASRAVTGAFARAGRRRGRDVQRVRRARPAIEFAIWLTVAVLIASIFAESLAAAVLLSAIFLLLGAIALGPLLRDLAGALVVLFERPFQIGDRISIGGREGEVTEIGWRAFRLQTVEGAIAVVPNSEALRSAVVNRTRGEIESRVETILALAPETDLAVARRRAYEAAAASPYLYLGHPVEVHLVDQARLLVRAYVFDAEYAERFSGDVVERWEQWARVEADRRRSERTEK